MENILLKLESILNESGAIIYSSYSTIKKGKLYTLGLNPGGSEGETIKDAINKLSSKTNNSYLDENWINNKGNYEIGHHALQRNFTSLIEQIGFDPRLVFSSNLLFNRSVDAKGSNYNTNAPICWEAHKEFIKIVDPDVFLVFGNSTISPYEFITKTYGLTTIEYCESGHGNWQCCFTQGIIEGRERILIGVPHLSRYSPKSEVINWIKSKINKPALLHPNSIQMLLKLQKQYADF